LAIIVAADWDTHVPIGIAAALCDRLRRTILFGLSSPSKSRRALQGYTLTVSRYLTLPGQPGIEEKKNRKTNRKKRRPDRKQDGQEPVFGPRHARERSVRERQGARERQEANFVWIFFCVTYYLLKSWLAWLGRYTTTTHTVSQTMVSQASCYSTSTDGRRYNRPYPPYLGYHQERRFHPVPPPPPPPSGGGTGTHHDISSRPPPVSVAMPEQQQAELDSPQQRKRIAVAVCNPFSFFTPEINPPPPILSSPRKLTGHVF